MALTAFRTQLSEGVVTKGVHGELIGVSSTRGEPVDRNCTLQPHANKKLAGWLHFRGAGDG